MAAEEGGQDRPEKRARRRRRPSTTTASGLLQVAPDLFPSILGLLEAKEFSAAAQSHRRLSAAGQAFRLHQINQQIKQLDVFQKSVRPGTDRVIIILYYPKPCLRYFYWDERGQSGTGLTLEQKRNEPYGHMVIVSNRGLMIMATRMALGVIRSQAESMNFGYGEGPMWPSRVVFLRSKLDSRDEQALLSIYLPLWPLYYTTHYGPGDFIVDDVKYHQLHNSPDYKFSWKKHWAITQVPGLIKDFSFNMWHNIHRWNRGLTTPDLFFTPEPAQNLVPLFPKNRLLLLDTPFTAQVLERWIESATRIVG